MHHKPLLKVKKKWAQIEKEMYSILFACNKFFEMIYGRTFIVENDHKPLITIFKKPIHTCPSRLQRMMMQLQRFDFELIYKPGKNLFLADALSRAYLNNCDSKTDFDEKFDMDLDSQICVINMPYVMTDCRLNEIRIETKNDPELQLLNRFIKQGWPKMYKKIPLEIKPYFKYKHELIESKDLLFKGQQLIIPKKLRKDIIDKIHYNHSGIVKCKNLAKDSFFWPGMCKQIEDRVLNCRICLTYRVTLPKEPLISHDIPTIPWYKVGADILFLGNTMYLLLVDYYSKWVELEYLGLTATSHNVVNCLKSVFSRLGIPAYMHSDGGPQFTSIEFDKFTKEWSITHIKSSPRYPLSNGMVERSKQYIKKLLRKAFEDKKDIHLVLLSYRNTPIDDSISPAQIMMSRRLRSLLPIPNIQLKPKLINFKHFNKKILCKQQKDSLYYNKSSKSLKPLKINQKVRYQEKLGSKWSFGTVSKKCRNRSYKITRDDGSSLIRNRRFIDIVPENNTENSPNENVITEFENYPPNLNNSSLLVESREEIYNTPLQTKFGRKIVIPDRLVYC